MSWFHDQARALIAKIQTSPGLSPRERFELLEDIADMHNEAAAIIVPEKSWNKKYPIKQ